jgi:hypothetical protein
MPRMKPDTLVIGCGDPRVLEALVKQCKQIEAEDGVGPYLITRFGAARDIALESTREAAVDSIRMALKVVHRIVLIEHDGGEGAAGCLAYQLQWGDEETELAPNFEFDLHREILSIADGVLQDELAGLGRAGEVSIERHVDHHADGVQRLLDRFHAMA